MAGTRAHRNRQVRQEELRAKLAAQGHIQHAIDIIAELKDLNKQLDSTETVRLSKAMDGHFKFIDKYLPSLKATELTTIDEDGQVTGFKVEFVDAKTTNDTK